MRHTNGDRPTRPVEPCVSPQSQDDSLRPGTVILDRYRIVSLLGKGGMGTVYRAEDQVLRQEVALKFLSAACASDPRSIRNLQQEVKISRQVTHNNVCRVYDIGDIHGRPFISMEYVDGEDLTSVLRRIGRLPQDKAIQIARQMCAGLQAAHDQGVLHRDLKPANVMLDGKGNVRIADFGIAAAVETSTDGEGIAGTPAYMAPELFTGAPTSIRSDIYGLGLVLYELFTGRVMFKAKTITELLVQHKRPRPLPRDLVADLDPAVEDMILRCLSQDPEQRPRSALAVLAGLPGGNPLAESLAAGQTPSPELVAAAGGSGKLRPKTAWGLVASIVAGLILLTLWETDMKVLYATSLPKPGAVLVDRAQEHIRALGFDVDDVHIAHGFKIWRPRLQEILDRDASPESWRLRLGLKRPTVVAVWYRQVPAGESLVAHNIKGRVSWEDPPPAPGSVQVRLDPGGHLQELLARPGPQVTGAVPGNGNTPEAAAVWSKLFQAADLDLQQFRPVRPKRDPGTFATVRAAWEGRYPENPRLQVRIEAAPLGDRPVAFHPVDPHRHRPGLGVPAPPAGGPCRCRALRCHDPPAGGRLHGLDRTPRLRLVRHRGADDQGHDAWPCGGHEPVRLLHRHRAPRPPHLAGDVDLLDTPLGWWRPGSPGGSQHPDGHRHRGSGHGGVGHPVAQPWMAGQGHSGTAAHAQQHLGDPGGHRLGVRRIPGDRRGHGPGEPEDLHDPGYLEAVAEPGDPQPRAGSGPHDPDVGAGLRPWLRAR